MAGKYSPDEIAKIRITMQERQYSPSDIAEIRRTMQGGKYAPKEIKEPVQEKKEQTIQTKQSQPIINKPSKETGQNLRSDLYARVKNANTGKVTTAEEKTLNDPFARAEANGWELVASTKAKEKETEKNQNTQKKSFSEKLKNAGKIVSDVFLGDENGNSWIDYIMNPALLDGGNSKAPAFETNPKESQEVLYSPEGMPYMAEKKNTKDSTDAAKAFSLNLVYNAPGYKALEKAVDKYVDPVLGTNIANADAMAEEIQRLKENNKIASAAGEIGGNLAGYYMGGQLVNSAPVLSNMTGQSAQTVANALTGGKLSAQAVQAGTKPLQNIIADTSVDVALDVLPSLTESAKQGATGGEIAKQAVEKTAQNLAFNTVGEAIPTVIDMFKSSKAKNATKSIDDVIKQADEVANIPTMQDELLESGARQIDELMAEPPRKQTEIEQLRNTKATPENHKKMAQNINSFVEKPLESPDGFVPTKYKNSNGLLPYSDAESYNFTHTGKNKTSNEHSFSDFVKNSLEGKEDSKYYFGKVSDELAVDIKNKAGRDFEGYNVFVAGDELRHIKKKHGNSKIEESRGQIAVNEENLSLLANVFNKPDSIILSPNLDGRGREVITFSKRINGEAIVATAISDGKRGLSVDTYYIKKAPAAEVNTQGPNHNILDELQGRQTGESGFFNDIIPTDAENVNAPSGDFLDEIAESVQKATNIPKTRIAKDSKFSKMDKDMSNLVKWYGDETSVENLEALRSAMIDFENTGSMDALNQIGELTAKLDDNFRGKTYTYPDKYKKNGSLKSKGVTYKYGDTMTVESILEDTIPAIDEIHASKALNMPTPQITMDVSKEIPYLRDATPSGGRVREESHSMNIGKGRVNNVDEDVQNAFIDNPNLYTQLSNAETVAKAQRIYDAGNARSEIYRMLDQKDPAAIPLGNKIVGDLIDEGRKDEAVELLRTMSTKLRESGQFSQAAAITMIKSDPETALRYVVRNIDDMNAAGKKKFGKKWKDFELTDAEAELFRNIKPGDTEAIKKAFESVGARLSKEYPVTAWEKVVELSRVGMLLNPRTNIRNLISNALLQPVRSITDRVSALGQNAYHLINPDFKVTQAITGGGKEEKQIATEVWNGVKESLLENTSRYEDVKGAIKDKQIFKGSVASKAFDKLFPGAIERANKAMGKNVDDSLLETARNFTYYLLEKGDEPFVKNNFVNRLASYMKAQGIKNIDEIPEDAIMLAKEEALKATFKDDNNFTNMLSSIKKNLGKGGEVIMPFTKTPANLAMRGIDYSPAGIVNTIKKAKSGADVGRIMDDLSKNITGTAAIALGYYLTKNGIITGALSSDKDEAAFQKQQGQLAYSIKVGDNYYNYDWAQPASIPIILGSAIAQSIEESDNEEKTAMEKIKSMYNIGQQAVTSAAESWVELSPLQTISDIFNTQYGSVPENVINEVLEFPQRFIPSALGALARTVDTTQRQVYSAENPIQTQIDTLKSKVPFLSKTLPAAYDTWGREIKRSDSTGEAAFAQMVNPGTLGNNSTTPIDGEIQRLYEATENKAVFPQKSAWTVDGQKLSNKEYSELQKEQGSLSYEMVETLIENPFYSNMDDSLKSKTIAELYSLTKALAENSVMDKPISSTNEKLAKIYNKNGADGVVQYLAMKSTADTDSSGSISQDEAKIVLDKTNLSREQKAYYWQLFNAGWKKNPYK